MGTGIALVLVLRLSLVLASDGESIMIVEPIEALDLVGCEVRRGMALAEDVEVEGERLDAYMGGLARGEDLRGDDIGEATA